MEPEVDQILQFSLVEHEDYIGNRLDKTLSALHPDLSRAQWQRLIKEQKVLVKDQPQRASYRLEADDLIVANLPPIVETKLLAEDIPLDICYEDEDIIVVNKNAGIVVHPSAGHDSGTLVNAILHHCPDLVGIGGEKRPGIVHRLDKDTSGLIIIAKNEKALNYMQAQFKERTISKTYLALCEGLLQPAQALIDAPIGRDPRNRKRMSVIHANSPRAQSAKARESQTRYETLETYDNHTLVACMPLTGRTHQIRVHMAYIKFPLVGDLVYGRRKPTLELDRHFLHAHKLQFKLPSGDELTLTADLPPELQAILTQISGKFF